MDHRWTCKEICKEMDGFIGGGEIDIKGSRRKWGYEGIGDGSWELGVGKGRGSR